MLRRLLATVAVLLVSVTSAADDAEVPFACDVIRPVSDVDILRTTLDAMTNSARRRAVGVRPGPVEIDVLEVYGPQLLHEAGNADAATALVQHQIDTTNRALADSGLGHITLRLRHVRFSRSHDTFQTARIEGEIEQDRQYYGADLVGFAVGEMPSGVGAAACRPPAYGPFCGVHWVQSVSFLQYPLAYVHEVGHNFGADHDAPNAMPREVDPHPFARAHCEPRQWRTIMSYGNPCLANAVLRFSNPGRMFRGAPTGASAEEDNARVIALSAPQVRDYFPATQNTGRRCEFRITFDGSEVPVAGATRTVVVERTRGECQPDITALDEWVRIQVAPNGTAERTEAQVTYLPNGEALARRGHFAVGEQPVSIEQASAAACMVPGGSFDVDANGWTAFPWAAGQGSLVWSPLDVNGEPGSGSAQLTQRGAQFGVYRCVAVEPSSRYIMRSDVFMPLGQQIDATDIPASHNVSVFDTTDCTGEESGGGAHIKSITGNWMRLETPFETFANTRSAKISINMNAGGAFTSHFDDIFLCKVGNASAQAEAGESN